MKRQLSIFFEKYIKAGKAPGRSVCEKFLEDKKHLFPGRNWKNVKDCVWNMSRPKKTK